ncbi:hypothetical protein [Bacillus sp. ISL-37]|uniref:hypothetical protein n=1 Tax=Bacillus sp. ISL-37 TaxID=2819123 RepID=UPI001BE9C265|nr:hypothetical protein [Bacillus sp. ISL-37]MBT2686017.1 hypothetical protein [Bacillus sp. ISL-37]
MGFWDAVGQGLKDISEKSADYQQEVERYMSMYAYKSKEELLKEAKRGGPMAKKVAIQKLLKNK